MESNNKGNALRYNSGKLRYDLVEPRAHEDMVKVLTVGANKYKPRNWEDGLSWTSVLASLKRHVAAFEKGEDYDPETGLLHMSHAACNVHFLNAYYYLYPEGDDRAKITIPKIGLDIDEVICDFITPWCEMFGMEIPRSWSFDREMFNKFDKLKEENKLDEFYFNLKPTINPDDLPFEPYCYITSRPVSSELTERWLDLHKFPHVPVYTVPLGASKVEAAKSSGVKIFVDDSYKNFKEINENGITCFLLDRPHNKRYDVGHFRINTINDLPWFKK